MSKYYIEQKKEQLSAMKHEINLKNVEKKNIFPLDDRYSGKDAVNDRTLSFTNYYMEMNGKPFMGVSGECHFSRVHENQWEDTILKMKMGGINIISTYTFWIHHEEREGIFRFDGNKNVRKFIQLCKKHDMYVIVRIGPFVHGECRNGGLPDWLYGKPFETRSTDEGFMICVQKWYKALAEQFEGLYFKDGGPIIATQIDNEYMHSSAPWELTTGSTNEWLPGGSDGNEYMIALKNVAQKEGILTPFYTCTGWGGAAAPVDEMLALWGGYAFWPWIFYDYRGPHPATPEYIYRDNHNNQNPKTYNFEPTYDPESIPYACCEMGGGMSCYYHYRFQFPYESVDAMANIKLAGGCNFLGYYMYRGGSNPKGETVKYLNECQCSKISYDYQAVLGEYGQVRPSYYRLKALHLFMKNFAEELCTLKTVLPEGSQDILPEDVDTLRFAIRTDGNRGFLFINNYQDHVECKDKKDETIVLQLADEEISFKNLSMAAGEEMILPFNMNVGGYELKFAKAQPLSVIKKDDRIIYFFFVPEGVKGEYIWKKEGLCSVNGNPVTGDLAQNQSVKVEVPSGEMFTYKLEGEHGTVEVVTLTREQSMYFFDMEIEGEKTAVLCDSPVIYDGEKISVESPSDGNTVTKLLMYPEKTLVQKDTHAKIEKFTDGIWAGVKIFLDKEELEPKKLNVTKVGPSRFTVEIPELREEYKDVLLQIDYKGDVANLFVDGELISDNFCNDKTWEVGLKEVHREEKGNTYTILITPLKVDAAVDVSSTMAGRMEQMNETIAELKNVAVKAVKETTFSMTRF